jgi:SAM-dependent methyltransferase
MSKVSSDGHFARALRIAGYNWPLYVAAGLGVVVCGTLALIPGVPTPVRWAGAIGAGVAAWYAAASFLAFHWMFDRSQLLCGQWLKQELAEEPARWIQINVGLEETTLPLEEVFAGSAGKTLDLYDPAVMTEPAVTRAKQDKSQAASVPVRPEALPVEDAWADLVVVTLAAHEIRNAVKRELFFRELRRIVSPTGKVVLVEHLRDLAAALAFGPGIFHFFPRSQWLQTGSRCGLELVGERSITPFVRVFVYRRDQRDG